MQFGCAAHKVAAKETFLERQLHVLVSVLCWVQPQVQQHIDNLLKRLPHLKHTGL